jgi:hypothetical protein
MFSSLKDKSIHKLSMLGSVLMIYIVFPTQAFAAQCAAPLNSGEGLTGILTFPTCVINTYLVPGAIALEIIFFIIGIIIYVTNGGNESKRTEGSQFMLWGILAIFVTLSVWGLVAIIRNTLQI